MKTAKEQKERQACFISKRTTAVNFGSHFPHGRTIPRSKEYLEHKLIWTTSCQWNFTSVIKWADQPPLALLQVLQLSRELSFTCLPGLLFKMSVSPSNYREVRKTNFFLASLCWPSLIENTPVTFPPKKNKTKKPTSLALWKMYLSV